MAKKPTTENKPATKKPSFMDSLPAEIQTFLKKQKARYHKEESLKEVVVMYKEIYDEMKKEFGKFKWDDRIYHKRSMSKFKNQTKRERIGGAVDSYYGSIFGASRTRDLTQRMRSDVAKIWTENPQKAINEGLIMTRDDTNPMTGEVEKIPVIDKEGGIIPRDNREFFKRKDGTQFKNPNYGSAIGNSFRKTVLGICSNAQGIKGAFILELSDKATDLEIPMNCLVKFTARTNKTDVIKWKGTNYITKNFINKMIEDLNDDLEQEIVDKEMVDKIVPYYNSLLDKDEKETYLFTLRSSKGTSFIECKNKKDFEKADFPYSDSTLDINVLYKEYMYAFTAECAKLLNFHLANQYLDEEKEEINWNEFVSLQDVNVVQINMEASMSGNITMYVDDESLLLNDVEHNENYIDTIRVLMPTNIKIDFGQDSKLNIIGSPFQFQEQDEERKPVYEEAIIEGKSEKIPVMQFPTIMAYGVYAIPEYKNEVETMDLTFEEEIDVETIFNGDEKEPEEEIEETEEDAEEDAEEEEELEDLEEETEEETDIW